MVPEPPIVKPFPVKDKSSSTVLTVPFIFNLISAYFVLDVLVK